MTNQVNNQSLIASTDVIQITLTLKMTSEQVVTPTPPELNIETTEDEGKDAMSPVVLEGEGWGSLEATQLVLNNLFYITVKVNQPVAKSAWILV